MNIGATPQVPINGSEYRCDHCQQPIPWGATIIRGKVGRYHGKCSADLRKAGKL